MNCPICGATMTQVKQDVYYCPGCGDNMGRRRIKRLREAYEKDRRVSSSVT